MARLPDCENFFEDMFIRFDRIHERDRRTDRHRITAWGALDSVARQKRNKLNRGVCNVTQMGRGNL